MDNQEGTAVLDAPSTAVEELTTPDEQPESVVLETPDQDEVETPETEPEDLPLEERPEFQEALKSEVAKARESERRQLEAKAKTESDQRDYEQGLAAAQWVEQNGAGRYIAEGVRAAVEEGREVDFNLLTQTAAQGMYKGVVSQVHGRYVQTFVNFFKKENPDFTIPADLIEKEAAARRTGNDAGMAEAWFALLQAAAREKELPGLLKEAEEAAKKRLKVETVKQASRTGPTTGLDAAGVPQKMTLREIDQMDTNKWLGIPQPERKRLLEEAHAREGRG